MQTVQRAGAIAVVLLRVGLGWLFLNAGLDKITDPEWTAAGYLSNSTKGPFKDLFLQMAGSGIVDQLVIWGLILIGSCIILGFLVRWASFWGIVMMLLFWVSSLPPNNGLVDSHIIYSLVFLFLMTNGAGLVFGLDKRLESSSFMQKHPGLKTLLG